MPHISITRMEDSILIESGRYEIDQEKRKEIYQRIEALLYQDYMDVWLFYDVAAVAYRKNVEGWNNRMFIENRTLYTYSHPLWFKDGHR
jgi:peptide/nickel transport system substrate-binding protein